VNTPDLSAALPAAPRRAAAESAESVEFVESVDDARSSRRETVLLLVLVGLVVAVALFGVAFPDLVAAAIAIGVLAVVVAFDYLLPSGELRSMAERRATRRVSNSAAG
jgi:hypothetical protein